ncbi:uncharacterized protein LOC117651155 [Thrips palmi]|uniref:Uncharacterized protein LOC117651155 n=1 Tax=Thrips palmi TaxID=161013 RepID=A0A6P9A0A2_THRPL|nr:uncharacterized protein LOC117651155 [Thrips palmi]
MAAPTRPRAALAALALAAFIAALAQPAAAQSGGSCYTPEDQAGTCIPVVQCPPLVALLRQRPVPPESVQFLRNSQCGFQANIPLVCCPNTGDRRPNPNKRPSTPNNRVWGTTSTTTPRPSRPSNPQQGGHVNLRLLPTDVCGVDLSQRIFGGNETDLDEFPWMALLQYRSARGQLGFYCGGVLISKRYVLTAAHCVAEDSIRLVSVRLGEHDTKTSPDCRPDYTNGGQICAAPAVDVPVERSISYPEYAKNDPNHYHDIALLRLSRDVQFTDWIKPICLPTSSEVAAKSYVGKKLWVAGWGKTETRSESDVKLKLAVPVVSNADCQPVYQKAAVRLSSGGQLCAGGAQGRDSCNGDSGGPLMGPDLHESGDIRWFSTGVVAFGPVKCGQAGWPGVYTRVAHYMPWILDTIRARSAGTARHRHTLPGRSPSVSHPPRSDRTPRSRAPVMAVPTSPRGALAVLAAFVLVLAEPAAAQSGSSCFTPDDRPGSCIPVVRCPPLVALLRKKPVPPESVQFLRNSQCGFEAAIPLVCCQNTGDRAPNPAVRPTTSNRVWPDPVTPPTSPSGPSGPSGPSPHDGHPNAGLLPTDVCGIDLNQRIFGGNETELGEFPWMALLEYRSPRGQLGFYCGGVLIAKRYVLTAAHCVQEDAIRLVSVRLGEHDTKTSPDCRPDFFGGQTCALAAVDVPVERAIPHPEYSTRDPNHYHDIALLRLSADVKFTEWVKPICLPVSAEAASKSQVGKRLWVAGWGKTEKRSESDLKLKVAVPVVSNAACEPVYKKASVRLSSNSQLCAGGEPGKDSCSGDSGGPLMAVEDDARDGSSGPRWYSTGVVAFGPTNCGTRGWPGVYTRVAHYMPWILDTITN